MIKFNELRSFNWILKAGKPVHVDLYVFWEIFEVSVKCVDWLSDCEGIPVTDEWLDGKFGFSYKDGADAYGEYRKNGCNIYKHDDEEGFYHFSLGSFRGKIIEIKFVHQLQNLYFALTGEELNNISL